MRKTPKTNKGAYEAGKIAREKSLMRVTPFYEEREIRDGRKVDVTAERDRFWFAGYDGLAMPQEIEAAA